MVSTSAVALLGYGAVALKRQPRWTVMALCIGWVAHGLALALHAFGVGEVDPGMRFGFAPALSATLWLVIMVYAIESRYVPLGSVARSLALAGAAVVVLAVVFPGELRPHAGSRWAPVHWVLGIASYGLFGAALLHAALLQRADARMRGKALGAESSTEPQGLPLLRLEKLTFRFVAAGFLALSATLLLGWWFAVPWHWDHKTIFSMLAWAVFAALLVGRSAFGWRGRRATRWLYAGGVLLLLAYAGSRFVLEVLLHRVS